MLFQSSMGTFSRHFSKSTRFAVLFLGLLSAIPAFSKTYYIDWVNGLDSNNGTSITTPWKRHPYMKGWTGSYSHAAGDRFVFKGGVTWPNSVFAMNIGASGSSTTPDYYGVDQTWFAGGSWTRPIFDAGGSPISGGNRFIGVSSYVTIDNIEFTGFYWDAGSGGYGTCMIAVGGAQNVNINNSYFHNWSHASAASGCNDDLQIVLGSTTANLINQVISNCVFDGRPNGTDSGMVAYAFPVMKDSIVGNMANGILYTSRPSYAEVSGCTFSNQHPSFSGVHVNTIEEVGPSPGTSRIFNNIVHDTTDSTFILGGWNGTLYIYNNVIYNTGRTIPVALETRGGSSTSYIYNNTIECSYAPYASVNTVTGGSVSSSVIRNNLFISDASGGGIAGSYASLTQDHNITLTHSQATAQGILQANQYKPMTANGVGVDGGVSISTVFNNDVKNVPRPQGANWDIGAYEFTTNIVNPPNNLPPSVSAIGVNASDVDPGTSGTQIYEGTTVQYSGSATDPNGDALAWQWIYSINGGADTVYQSGSGSVPAVNFTYNSGTAGRTYVWKLLVTDGQLGAQSQTTMNIIATPAPVQGLTFQASAGIITSPFALNGNYISQTVQTTVPTNGGRAAYNFTITNAGYYVLQTLVNAPNSGANSLFVNIDAEPQDPVMIWDSVMTSGFENRLVSWRGNGTDTANQFVPKVFNLAAGAHQLIFRGREANMQLQSFSILQLPAPPQNLRVLPTVVPSATFSAGSQ